jgi:hypothetical protein
LNVPAVLAAVLASVAVWAHGIAGQRWFVAQLGSVELQPTKPWGDADVTRRVFAIAWNIGTAFFLASAVTLFLIAFEAVESRELLRFVAIVHAAILVIGTVYLGKRLETLTRPFAALVVTCLAGVSVFPWFA